MTKHEARLRCRTTGKVMLAHRVPRAFRVASEWDPRWDSVVEVLGEEAACAEVEKALRTKRGQE